MMSLSFLFGRSEPSGLFERSRNCVLTTINARGQPHARRVRVAACSDDGTHLWFVIARDSGIVADVLCDANVMLSVMHPGRQELVHVSGLASVLGDRHSPVYLAPDFCQTQQLGVVSDDIDITLLKVDVSDQRSGAVAAGDSEPPHRIFRLFQIGAGNVSDTGTGQRSQ
jgi:general stress protein 26